MRELDLFDLLSLRIYLGSAPVFLFSMVTYVTQTLYLIHLFRYEGLQKALGKAALLVVGSYSAYELAFKLSFLAFGYDYIRYFINYDLYPTAVFIFSILAVLGIIDDRVSPRRFVYFATLSAVLWAIWLISGYFPVDMRSYEANPSIIAVLFNLLTKVFVSLAFVVMFTGESCRVAVRSSLAEKAGGL